MKVKVEQKKQKSRHISGQCYERWQGVGCFSGAQLLSRFVEYGRIFRKKWSLYGELECGAISGRVRIVALAVGDSHKVISCPAKSFTESVIV